jgi:ankyrin repeat protein
MLKSCLNRNKVTKGDRSTPLCLISKQGHLEIAKVLVKKGTVTTHPSKDGRTPLCHSGLPHTNRREDL